MTLVRQNRFGFDFPEIWRRFVDGDGESGGWLRVEEQRDGDDLVVRAELPGIDPDRDVELSVSDGVLQVRARREERSEHKDDDNYRSEFRYGSFVRNVALPGGVEEGDIRAEYKDGILEVRIPGGAKRKESSTKIPIQRG